MWGVIWAVIVWLKAGLIAQQEMWIPSALTLLSTYLMVELNNNNALIRIYSRTVSVSFLLLTCMASFNFADIRGAVVTICAIGFYYLVFHTYQNSSLPGTTYYAFLIWGISSVLWGQVLFFVPILWLLMVFKLQSMSFRTFVASLLGLITPYWFGIVYCLVTENLPLFINHFTEIAVFGPIADVSLCTLPLAIFFGCLAIITLLGMVHFLRTRQNDRIRIQKFYECMILVALAAWAFLVLQPQHYRFLTGIIIVNIAPPIAHFIALTHTKWTNLTTMAIIVAVMIITLFA